MVLPFGHSHCYWASAVVVWPLLRGATVRREVTWGDFLIAERWAMYYVLTSAKRVHGCGRSSHGSAVVPDLGGDAMVAVVDFAFRLALSEHLHWHGR
jgi:hypothetical protein